MVETRHTSELHRGQQHAHHKFDDIANDRNYELITLHDNQRGDLTMVFQNQRTGEKISFPNVNRDHVPQHLLKKNSGNESVAMHRAVHTLDEVKNDPNFHTVDSHINAYGNQTVIYENEKTGEEVVFPNVKQQ